MLPDDDFLNDAQFCKWIENFEGRTKRMKAHFYLTAVVLLVVGYYVGTHYPNFWKSVTA